MPIDDCFVYIIVRQDIPETHQAVQSLHAVYHLASLSNPDTGLPNMVLAWARDYEHLEEILARTRGAQITHYAWKEPDQYAVRRFFNGQAFTALAAGPVEPAQRSLFRDLEKVLYSPVVSINRTADSKSAGDGERPSGRASLPCA